MSNWNDYHADYEKSYRESKGNVKAMRTVGLKTMLALLIREYGLIKVLREVEWLRTKVFSMKELFEED